MIGKAMGIWRDEGALVLAGRAARLAKRKTRRHTPIELAVAREDVLAADWSSGGGHDPDPGRAALEVPGHLRINWVIPAIGTGAGGHANILRFVRALEARGHDCTLFVYDPHGYQTENEARHIARHRFPPMRAQIHHGVERIDDCDALIATAWQTAYPVFNAPGAAGKFYWVQDYEPYFHPIGTESVLAEATYRFGLHGICLGRWLSTKLSAEYGMTCDAYEFGSDAGVYSLEQAEGRDKVLFYARPSTPRRGFELGAMVLELVARAHPELEIHMLGGNLGSLRLPFRFVEHGILSTRELNALYNESVAALVLSFTNMSLLPLELLSAGCIPVLNDGDNNRLVSDNPFIAYEQPSVHLLARALCDIVEHPDRVARASAASASVQALDWEHSASRVEEILFDVLRGRVSRLAALAPRAASPS